MSRGRLSLATTLGALAVVVVAAAPAGGREASAGLVASDCVPTLHAKKVTVRRKVGRKGHRHLRKVTRTKRWWTCEFPPVAPNRLRVRAREWSLTLSRASAEEGDLTVELANEGEDPHNLRLELPGGPSYSFADLDPGQLDDATLPLTTGTWRLYCSLPGHEEAGMHASLVVN